MQLKVFSLVNFEIGCASIRTALNMRLQTHYHSFTKYLLSNKTSTSHSVSALFLFMFEKIKIRMSKYVNTLFASMRTACVTNGFMRDARTQRKLLTDLATSYVMPARSKGGLYIIYIIWDIIFFKNLAVRILAQVSAYWRSDMETSTKNSLNYELMANYANN